MGDLPFEKIKRKTLVKAKLKSDPKYGKKPSDRTVAELLECGIVNLNKPSGPSSHQVGTYLRDVLKIKKSGHSGTLDPKVTGVLPVALGLGTRVIQMLLTAGKEYVCRMHLHNDCSEEDVKKVLASFVGKIRQMPPVRSAVKRQWRNRRVYYIEFLDLVDKEVLFRVGCQAGTYIRKLCTDVGDKLGTGAHMAELVRTKAGPFTYAGMTTLQDVRDALWYYEQTGNEKFIRHCLLPIEEAVGHLPKVYVDDSVIGTMCHGVDLMVGGVGSVESEIQVDEDIAVMSLKGELIALGKSQMTSQEMVDRKKGTAIKTYKVLMAPGVYPK